MIKCKNCGLWKQSKSGLEFGNFIEGVGSKDSKVMIVFDTPFMNDISVGKLFSDTKYKTLLNNLLSYINLSVEDTYVTTLLKCFPSDKTKKPNNKSIEKCFELHLKQEIETIQPKVILLCGSKSSKFFIPELVNMTQAVGNYFYSNIYKCYCLPVFNLYYLSNMNTYAPQYKKVYRALGKVKSIINKQEHNKFNIEVTGDATKLDKLDKIVAIDLETTGLSYNTDKILTIGISDLKTNLAFDVGLGKIPWTKIYSVLKTKKIIAHNANFEIKFLKANNIHLEDNIIGDTKLMQFLLNPLGATSLGFLAQLYFGYAYKDTIDRTNMIAMEPEPRAYYCGTDTHWTIRLFYKLYKELQARGSENAYKVFMRLLRVTSNLEYKGILIDQKVLKETMVEYNDKKEEILRKFKKSLKLPEEFNVNSSKQLREVIYDILKLPVTIKTDSGQPSTNATAIETLAKKKPILKTLVDYRTYKGHIEKLSRYHKEIKGDGRIHGEFSLFSPDSSRVMSKKPNIQNVPRNSRIKEIFVAPEGYSYIYWDYSALEFRVWIHLANDPKGIEFVNSGKDIHRFIASRFWRKPEKDINKDERNTAKTVVYASLYGSTPDAIALREDVPIEQAKQIQRIFFNICKKGYFWMKGLETKIVRDKYIKTPFGSYKFLPDIEMAFGKKKEEMIRSGKNFIVQSWAVELVFIGMYKVYKAIKEQGLDAMFVHQIHDACIVEVRNDHIDKLITIVKENAVSPVKLSVPLDVEIKLGTSWANLKQVDKED